MVYTLVSSIWSGWGYANGISKFPYQFSGIRLETVTKMVNALNGKMLVMSNTLLY